MAQEAHVQVVPSDAYPAVQRTSQRLEQPKVESTMLRPGARLVPSGDLASDSRLSCLLRCQNHAVRSHLGFEADSDLVLEPAE